MHDTINLDSNQQHRLKKMTHCLLEFRTLNDFPGVGPKSIKLFHALGLIEFGFEEGQGTQKAVKLTELGSRTLSKYNRRSHD